MNSPLKQSLETVRQAFNSYPTAGLKQAMSVLCDAFEVDSAELAEQVVGHPTRVPLFAHVLVRVGSIPHSQPYMTVEHGIELLEILLEQGADVGIPFEFKDRSYTPLELLFASLPGKVRGEDFEPLVRFLVEKAGVATTPVQERRFGENEDVESFLVRMGQEGSLNYLKKSRLNRLTATRRR